MRSLGIDVRSRQPIGPPPAMSRCRKGKDGRRPARKSLDVGAVVARNKTSSSSRLVPLSGQHPLEPTTGDRVAPGRTARRSVGEAFRTDALASTLAKYPKLTCEKSPYAMAGDVFSISP